MRTGVAQSNARGQRVCGDAYAIVETDGGLLVAVIDGVGHGPEAHRASVAAREVVERSAALPLLEILRLTGEVQRGLRGVCMALARIRPDGMECVSVGNVEVIGVAHQPVRVVTSPGVVGQRVRKVITTNCALAPGDRIAIFSDGISRRTDLSRYGSLNTQSTAEAVLADHAPGIDDATCLVVDLL